MRRAWLRSRSKTNADVTRQTRQSDAIKLSSCVGSLPVLAGKALASLQCWPVARQWCKQPDIRPNRQRWATACQSPGAVTGGQRASAGCRSSRIGRVAASASSMVWLRPAASCAAYSPPPSRAAARLMVRPFCLDYPRPALEPEAVAYRSRGSHEAGGEMRVAALQGQRAAGESRSGQPPLHGVEIVTSGN